MDFRPLEPGDRCYLDAGEWPDRAGAYAIQNRGALLVRGIEGDYLNVVGLPVATLCSSPRSFSAPEPSSPWPPGNRIGAAGRPWLQLSDHLFFFQPFLSAMGP